MTVRQIPTSDRDTRRIARFVDKIAKEPNSGCWLWTGAVNTNGYGFVFWHGRFNVYAHRVSYAIHIGDPGRLCVCHRCDTPLCVNPDHLFLGTVADNNADKILKGRQGRGPRVTHCKRGHEMTGDNVYISPDGGKRFCRQCNRVRKGVRRTRPRCYKNHHLLDDIGTRDVLGVIR